MLGESPETRLRGLELARSWHESGINFGARQATESFVEDLKKVASMNDKNILLGGLMRSLEDE